MPFGQLVIGPPGAGKSTYCDGLSQFYAATGRPVAVVNLDPANTHPSYSPVIDIRAVLPLDRVMAEETLGPNGGILFALDSLVLNFDWLADELQAKGIVAAPGAPALPDPPYVLFDCPGQVELFTAHGALPTLARRLEKECGFRLAAVQLLDSFALTQPSVYVSSLVLALRGMLLLELPHINVLSKIDNLGRYPPLPFNLDFYTDVQDLRYLLPHVAAEPGFPGARAGRGRAGAGAKKAVTLERVNPVRQKTDAELAEELLRDDGADEAMAADDGEEEEDDPTSPRARLLRLTGAIADLVDDFGLLTFHTLAIEDRASVAALVAAVDVATGYVFVPSASSAAAAGGGGGGAGRNPDQPNEAAVWTAAMREGGPRIDVRDVQERWVDRREEMDEIERDAWAREAGVGGGDGPEWRRRRQQRREEDGGGDMWNPRAALDDFPDIDDPEAVARAARVARGG